MLGEKCKDCGELAVRCINGEDTCTECGRVFAIDYIDYSAPRFGESEYGFGEGKGSSSPPCFPAYVGFSSSPLSSSSSSSSTPLLPFDVYKLIETTCCDLGLPDSVVKTATALFVDYTSGNIIMAGHRIGCIMACVYFAQGALRGGARTKSEFRDISANPQVFLHACTELDQYIRQSSSSNKWQDLAMANERNCLPQLSDTIGRIMSKELYVPEDKRPDVRKLSNKIYDKIKGSSDLVGIREMNIHTACVYWACTLSHIHVDQALIKCMGKSTTKKLLEVIHGIIVIK